MAPIKATDKQAVKDWDAYLLSFVEGVESEQNESPKAKEKRIEKLEGNFEEWKKYYFPKYCFAPAAPFHIKGSRRILNNPEWYESRVYARELAKDTVCMIETLFQALSKYRPEIRKRNNILISNSYDKACKLLKPYKINLEKNERLIADYGIQQLPGNWSDGDFTTTGGISFIAVGAGQSPRGSRNEEVRPDKIIITDIDTDEDCRNKDIIDKRWEWFEGAVFPTRSVSKDFQVIWLGNLISEDCCVARAMKMADKVDIVNLEDEEGNSTWPGKNKPEHIARIKSKISTKAYQQEYMNNPLSEGVIFKELTWGKCPQLSTMPYVVNYADPSPSNKEKQKKGVSYKAQFLVGYKDGKFYIYTGYLEQVVQSVFVQWFYDIRDYVRGRSQTYNYVENNKLQDPFFEQVFKPMFHAIGKIKGFLNITPDDRKKPDKATRIEGTLEPLNRNSQLVFNIDEKDNPHMKRLAEQFRLFSMQLKAPADGPDCIEGAVWILNEKITAIAPGDWKSWSKSPNKKRI